MHFAYALFQSWLTFSVEFFGLILFIATLGHKVSLQKGAQYIAEKNNSDGLGFWVIGLALLAAMYHILWCGGIYR